VRVPVNINIKSFFIFIACLLLSLLILLVYYTLELSQRSNDLKEVESNRYLMIQKADELRQSSDDLTRFCRTYVVSTDRKYRDRYFRVLDIRNGKIERPKNYEHIYWDLLEPIRKNRHPDEKKTSIYEEIFQLPYTEYEFQKLQEAENNSNHLVYLEIEALNAMDGLFKDKDGEYTVKSERNQSLAIALLYSIPYYEAKEEIMLPIDQFLSSLAERTKKEVKSLNHEIKLLFEKVFILFALGGLTLASTLLVITKKILQPIDALTKAILSFRHGSSDIEKVKHYDDEIGIMVDQFFIMKGKLDEDYKEIEKLALTDPLTQIGNRRAFFEIAKHYLKLAHRENELFSLIMFDIDFFKKINDTYGHIVGDKILKFLAGGIKEHLRESDIFARIGGEEFIILLPKTNIEEALGVAQSLRDFVENHPYKDDTKSIPVTISLGVSQFKDEKLLSELVHRVDTAVYSAKEKGRNRVEVG